MRARWSLGGVVAGDQRHGAVVAVAQAGDEGGQHAGHRVDQQPFLVALGGGLLRPVRRTPATPTAAGGRQGGATGDDPLLGLIDRTVALSRSGMWHLRAAHGAKGERGHGVTSAALPVCWSGYAEWAATGLGRLAGRLQACTLARLSLSSCDGPKVSGHACAGESYDAIRDQVGRSGLPSPLASRESARWGSSRGCPVVPCRLSLCLH